MGVPLRSYQAWERGENEPSDKKAQEARRALGIVPGRVTPDPLTVAEAEAYYGAPRSEGAPVLIVTVQNGTEVSTHELRWSHGPPLHVGIATTTRGER